MVYYNEHDPLAAEWLIELVSSGDLPLGLVDARGVQELGPADLLDQYDQCHFFAGIGGWPHALDLAGWPRDRPIWTASLPCQPFSEAGKGLGVDDDRHLWPVFHRLVEHYRPECIVGEQVASKAGRAWFAAVQTDLEKLGYWCGAIDICAAGVGAPHIRQRLYWCAVRLGDSPGERPTSDKHGNLAEGRPARKDRSASGSGGVADNEERRRGQVGTLAGGCIEGNGAQGCERPEHGGSAGGVADSNGRGREEHTQENLDQREPVGQSPERNDSLRRGDHGRNPWGNVVAIPCADGKSRLLESCAKPLADGVSAQLVRGGDPGAPQVAFPPLVSQQTDDVNDTSEARAMRLKGYGNAIVPPLAAEFIRVVMEILNETPTRKKSTC